MKAAILTLIGAVCLAAPLVQAGPLTRAQVTKVINQVEVVDPASGTRSARVNDVIKDQIGLKTGVKSRSELLFEDNTLTRLGPESFFSFKAGTRDMTLQQGTMLLQVPKGLGGARIRTAAVTASITGTTIMIEYEPKQRLKVLVLEGSLRLSRNGTFGDSLLLTPGKMVIMRPDARRIPNPVSVDLKHVVRTSSLIKMGAGKNKEPLPSIELINKEIDTQQNEKGRSELIATNLVILGGGSTVTVASDSLIANLDRATQTIVSSAATTPSNSSVPSDPITPSDSSTPSSPTTPSDPASTPQPSSSVSPTPATTPDPSATPGPTSTPDASSTPSASPGNAPTTIDDALVLNYGTADQPLTKDFSLKDSVDLSTNGTHGNVNITTIGKAEIKKDIKVSSDATKGGSKAGGNITVESLRTKEKDPGIVVQNSAQLLSLLNAAAPGPGGTIKFTSAGGKIQIDKATLVANRGTIDIRNNGDAGTVSLNNANLNADTVKIGALGNNGTLTIGKSTISADSAIKLYAAGSNGQVRFTDDVTLSGNSAKTIAADTVTIDNKKTVTINGNAPANVFTNHPNYTGSGGNNTTTGTFGGQGATTQPLSALPPGG